MDNAIALGVQPLKIDVATPLLQAAKIRQEQVETQQRVQALQQDAAGQFARGVAVYADKPEFAQKWAEGLDDLHSRGLMPTQAYESLRNNPSPLVLKSIIAKTEKPELALQREKFGEAKRHAGVLETQGQAKIDIEAATPKKGGESLSGDIMVVRDPTVPGGLRRIDISTMPALGAPQPGGPQPAAAPGAVPPPSVAPAAAPAAGGAPVVTAPAAVVPPAAPGANVPTVQTPRQTTTQKFLTENYPNDKGAYKTIEGVADYEINPASLSMKNRTKIIDAATALAASRGEVYDQRNYTMSSQTMNAFAKGKEGASVRSFSVGIDHLDQLGELGKALNNGNIQASNKFWNWAKTQLGYEGPTNFAGLKQIVGAEVIKAIVGAGGGVTEREEAAKIMAGWNSPEQTDGIIRTLKNAMGAQLVGLERQYATGTFRKDFREKLSPAAVRILEAHEKGGHAPAASEPAAAPADPLGIR